MESLPTWLSDAVYAAGMTAYADDLYPKAIKESPALAEDPAPPIH